MRTVTVATCLAITCTFFNSASAQIKASERATLSQVVDGTTMVIEYSRPSLRGRDHVFSTETVPDSVLWTPGADSATTFAFNKDVTIEGTHVPAGRYSVWMVTGEDEWEVVLDSSANRFHLPHPKRVDGQIVFPVRPDTMAPRMESLLFYFPEVRSNGADLRMHWDRKLVQMRIDVQPSRILTISDADAAPYIGQYSVVVHENKWQEEHKFVLDLQMSDGYLYGKVEFSDGDDPFHTYFAPKADQVFNPVWVLNGTVAAVINDLYFEFNLDADGHAETFETRSEDDDLVMSGTRAK